LVRCRHGRGGCGASHCCCARFLAGVLRSEVWLALVQAGNASCARAFARQGALALRGNDAVAVVKRCIHAPPRVIDEERERGASSRSSSRHVAVRRMVAVAPYGCATAAAAAASASVVAPTARVASAATPADIDATVPATVSAAASAASTAVVDAVAVGVPEACLLHFLLALHAAPCGAVLLHQLLYLLLHWQCRQVRRARSPCGDGCM